MNEENKVGFMRLTEVKEVTSLSSSTIRRMEVRGEFPIRFNIGKRAVAWDREEVNNWINNCINKDRRHKSV